MSGKPNDAFYCTPTLNQDLARRREKRLNLPLQIRVDHRRGPSALRAGEPRRGPEQAADQRPLRVDLTTFFSQMRTTEIGKRRLMFRVALDGKPRHFLAGRGHRSAAIVTTGEALEGGDAPSKKADFLIIAGHGAHFLGVCGVANFACGMKDGSP